MASFIQTANSATASAEKRRLYAITRSESTWLISTYEMALQKGEANGMEPYRLFRDALENKKPAYLGKFNNSYNAVVQGTFYAMATHLFSVIQKLFARVENDHHHTKVKNLCKDLPTNYTNAYSSISNLNWAVYNRHYYRNEKNIIEDLGDSCFENNSCTVCDFTGNGTYYFSTAYGVEKPICENCLPVDESDEVDTKNDSEYVVSEEEEESDCEPEASGDEEEVEEVSEDDDENDPDYVPEEEESEEEDEDEDEDEDEEEDEDASEADANEADANEVEDTTESEDDPDYVPESEDEETFFGCTGCPYEWRAGFKHGWLKAMKHMRDYASQQKRDTPAAPECASCGDSREDLQKCGRCKSVRYCSEECQREDWSEHKQVCRR